MKTVIEMGVVLEVERCGTCGIPFAAPDYFWEQRQRDGKTWYCPNGHQRMFTETDHSRLVKTKTEVARLENLLADEQRAVSHLVRRVADKDQEIKRMNRRAKAGVCQDCHRMFQNVARHMQIKHGTPTERAKAIETAIQDTSVHR